MRLVADDEEGGGSVVGVAEEAIGGEGGDVEEVLGGSSDASAMQIGADQVGKKTRADRRLRYLNARVR